MITVQEALSLILSGIGPAGVESVGLSEALGRVLGQDAVAVRPNPLWDNSAMDGYAVRAADVAGASSDKPVKLRVLYDLPAGKAPMGLVMANTAVRIMTGAPMPEGADSVVMVEQTEQSDDSVLIKKDVRAGENVRKRGEDFCEGDVVVGSGSLIRSAEVAMLATIGVAYPVVHRRPRVAIVSTGDELEEVGTELSPGKITNSNGHALSALVAECNCTPINLGIARDTEASLIEKFTVACKADCIISSGGVSVGDYDLVKQVLSSLGSEMRFWKVAMKPGKPLAFGVIGGKPAFGLPGNPISSMVAFHQFVRPALLKMSGRKDIYSAVLSARLTKDVKIKPGRMNFLRADLMRVDGGFEAAPLEGQGSSIISTMVRSNAFIVVPQGSSGFKAGEIVKVQPFDLSLLCADAPGY